MAVFAKAKTHATPLPSELDFDFTCRPQVDIQLERSLGNAIPQWNRVADANFETKVFRSPVEKVGEWLELRLAGKKSPELFVLSRDKMIEYSWLSTCETVSKILPPLELFKKDGLAEAFTDADLEALLKSKKKGVLYLWSPNMTYSVTEFRLFRDVAKKRKMEFIPILDHQAKFVDAKAAAKVVGVDVSGRKLASVDLYMRHGTLHFPTVFVFANGKIHQKRIVGILTATDFDKMLGEWLKELE